MWRRMGGRKTWQMLPAIIIPFKYAALNQYNGLAKVYPNRSALSRSRAVGRLKPALRPMLRSNRVAGPEQIRGMLLPASRQ